MRFPCFLCFLCLFFFSSSVLFCLFSLYLCTHLPTNPPNRTVAPIHLSHLPSLPFQPPFNLVTGARAGRRLARKLDSLWCNPWCHPWCHLWCPFQRLRRAEPRKRLGLLPLLGRRGLCHRGGLLPPPAQQRRLRDRRRRGDWGGGRRADSRDGGPANFPPAAAGGATGGAGGAEPGGHLGRTRCPRWAQGDSTRVVKYKRCKAKKLC